MMSGSRNLMIAQYDETVGTYSWCLPAQFLFGLPDGLTRDEINQLGNTMAETLQASMVAIMMAALADPRQCSRLVEVDKCFKQMAQILQQAYQQKREAMSETVESATGASSDT